MRILSKPSVYVNFEQDLSERRHVYDYEGGPRESASVTQSVSST